MSTRSRSLTQACKERPRAVSQPGGRVRGRTAELFTRRVVAKVWITSSLDADIKLEVKGAQAETAVPETLKAGADFNASFVAQKAATTAFVTVAGFPPLTLSLRPLGGPEQIAAARKQCADLEGNFVRHTFVAAKDDDGDKTGRALETEVVGSRPGCGVPLLRLRLRDATDGEIKRTLQLEALQAAAKGDDYGSLHAQISKARTAGVESEQITRAEQVLRGMQRQRKHVEPGCSWEELKKTMQWDLVTHVPQENVVTPCPCADCQCNNTQNINLGESVEIDPTAVQLALGGDTKGAADEELFTELVDAALKAPEGCVWTAGGKLIFSAFDRNQSVIALTRMLKSQGKEHCAKLILRLVQYTEARFTGFVTAIQVNFHPGNASFHGQHRDIYSAKQRAGPNCTCAFRPCVGTACYSVGSSRKMLMEAMTDDMSPLEACSETCQSSSETAMLHSGSVMFFNEGWNNAHTHGIPTADYECGPRISLAMLLGADTSLATKHQVQS